MGIMTVDELLRECQKMQRKGFGGCKIYISTDDEGNSFHPLFYTFETNIEDVERETGTTDAVLLG